MKQIILPIALCSVMLSCQNNAENSATDNMDSTATTTSSAAVPATDTAGNSATFDLNTIPLSDKDLGKFPYLVLPTSYKYGLGDEGIRSADIREPDREYFAVTLKPMLLKPKTK